MGKKRKKTSREIELSDIIESTPAPPLVVTATTTSVAPPEPPVSRPALTEEKAAALIAEAIVEEKIEEKITEPAPEVAPVVIAAAPTVAAVTASVSSAPVAISEAPASMSEPPASMSEPPASMSEPPARMSEPPTSEAAPSTVAPKKKKKTKKRVSRASLDKKIDRLEAKLTEKKEEAAKAARDGFGSAQTEDDTSVPPVDLEVQDAFFAAGEKEHPITKESGAYSAVDARHAQKMTPHAHARRAHLSRYVLWAVSGAAAILLLGVTIKTFRGPRNEEPVRHEVTHVTQPVEQPQQAQTAAPNNVAPPPEVVELPEVKVDDGKENAAADSADAKAPEVAEKQADMPNETPKTAYQEKVAAKAALERGSNGAAIAAGERSVALDASDGEAWLVLGGAYQAMGNNTQAKRCYNACVSQGKKGPIGDCRDMLSSL